MNVSESTDLLKQARQLTNDFYNYYHHTAPFSRRALEEIWRRCETALELRESCIEARSNAEQRLGQLEVGVP